VKSCGQGKPKKKRKKLFSNKKVIFTKKTDTIWHKTKNKTIRGENIKKNH